MRIVSGRLGGRVFNDPPGYKAHPMSEKIRGALFNALGDVNGLAVLDCYGGSGALAFEAISRGAAHATVIEKDPKLHTNILENVRMLQIEGGVKVVRANASGWSDNNSDKKFDLVLCDPPYDKVSKNMLSKLANHAKAGGLVVFSLPPKVSVDFLDTRYSLLSTKSYGDSTLEFYKKLR